MRWVVVRKKKLLASAGGFFLYKTGSIVEAKNNAFSTMEMTGSLVTVTGIDRGDRWYGDTPLTVRMRMEINHGRSGSPLFWRGYVIGLVTFFVGDNRTDAGAVASDAILKDLKGFSGLVL